MFFFKIDNTTLDPDPNSIYLDTPHCHTQYPFYTQFDWQCLTVSINFVLWKTSTIPRLSLCVCVYVVWKGRVFREGMSLEHPGDLLREAEKQNSPRWGQPLSSVHSLSNRKAWARNRIHMYICTMYICTMYICTMYICTYCIFVQCTFIQCTFVYTVYL